jgi:hypothetical protein
LSTAGVAYTKLPVVAVHSGGQDFGTPEQLADPTASKA